MKKLLIGGSSSRRWSTTTTKEKGTRTKGLGWALFKTFVLAREKFKPDYFLYENGENAPEHIKEQISRELGTPLQYINSGLVSAQNRNRFYVHNFGNIGQPDDKGLTIEDIINSHNEEVNRWYCLSARGRKGADKKTHQFIEVRDDLKAESLSTVSYETLYAKQIEVNNLAELKSIHMTQTPYGDNDSKDVYGLPITLAEYALERNNFHRVRDGKIITRYGTQEVNLPDGNYSIRKFTPEECEMLQTLPKGYTSGISKAQRYKCIGNAWTAEVIKFILSHMECEKNEELVVLSMFDGIGTGRYVLDQLGYTNLKYFAYEIDNNAIKVAKNNYPDIVELGSAFKVKGDNWELPI